MLDAKTLGWLQVIVGAYAGWISWQVSQSSGDYSVLALSILVLLMGLSAVKKK